MLNTLENLISIFYPRLCAGCQNALQQNETHICLDCMIHLPETNFHTEHENELRLIFAGRVEVQEVASLLFYKKGNRVQKLLHNLKYKGEKELGAILGEYYGHKLIQETRFQDIDLIVPIPLHTDKQKSRGYNQSEWIAKGLSTGMAKPYRTDILLRHHYTETQTRKSRFNRWENVKSVFAVENGQLIEGKHILLCDDVLTTGATTEAAIQQLIETKNVKVSVVTLATAHN